MIKKTLALLFLFASVAAAQPYYQWNNGLIPSIQGEAVYFDTNGNLQVVDFYGSGGSVAPSLPGANGQTVHYMPAFSIFQGGAKSARWVSQAADQPNFNNQINVPVNTPAQPVIAAPALAAVGGESWTFYVKWTQASINDALAKGINGPLNFTAAVFPASRKRTDGIIQTTGTNYADSTGSAHVTAYGLKSFSPVKQCRVDVIFGGKVTGLQGNGGKTYTATMGERIWTDANGNFLSYYDTPWTLNYVTVARVGWTFTEE